MELLKYISRRVLFLFILVFGITSMVFILTQLVPGEPELAYLSQRNLSDKEVVAAFRARWGLDQPLYIQYFKYMENLVQGDLGTSFRTNRPVLVDLKQYLPATIELALVAIIIATFFGILFGVLSATWPNSFIDHFLRTISVTGVSIPSFWLALLVLYVFYFHLGWSPGPGRIGAWSNPPDPITNFYIIDSIIQKKWDILKESLQHLFWPALVLGTFTMGLITRTNRSSLLETMSMDYIRTARAKGLGKLAVVTRHAFGNAFIPVITVIGLGFGNLLGGAVLVETIFSWPGIGMYAYRSAVSLDYPAITGVALLIAVNYVIINLIVDILYGIIDPRIRYQ